MRVTTLAAAVAFRKFYVRKGSQLCQKMRNTSPTGMSSTFDSEQLICVLTKYLQQ